MKGIPVLAAPAIDPGSARLEVTLSEGLTVDQIVMATLPNATAADRQLMRVMLVSERGSAVIPPEHWHTVKPRPGVRVVIRLIPGRDALRSILQIVVTIAAAYFAPLLAPVLGITSATGVALLQAGLGLVGSLLINALIPPVQPDNERRNSYSISGWRNRLDLDGAVPILLGQIRYAPPYAARSHTEVVGDLQFIRAFFNFGEGPLELSDFRIGDTSIDEFTGLEIEVRQGLDDDLPSDIYPRQIVEEPIGVELTRPFPRDDLGERIEDDPTIETPIVRSTGADASSASVILSFPAGMVRFDSKGRKNNTSVSIRIDHRLAQGDEWLPVTTLIISAAKLEGFYRQHTWAFPTRGRWQVRLTMMTDETEDSQIQNRTVWAALQTLRPEYPLAYPHPLALVAVRVKATYQLSGALDNFSALAKRICLDWDHVTETWIKRPTSNPAALYRFILQCQANPKPATDAEIDLELLADWHDFCRLKGLHYNRVQDQAGTTLREVLTEVSAAGRASPRHDGVKWGVVIDRPQELIVDHVNPRNSWGFSTRRAYVERPHAWICKFQDEGNDFKEAQRVIRRPGYVGDITLTETLELPGITNAAIVWREGYRRFLEALYRPDVYEATQEGAVRVATRGDAVMLSYDVLSRMHWAGRVRSVSGNLVELDEAVVMEVGQSYAIRFRVFEGPEDTIGNSIVRPVQTVPGETNLLTMTGTGSQPTAGDIAHFGVAGTDSYQVIVSHIEATEDQCQIVRAVDAAPIIDELTDAAVIPAWSSRVGEEIGEDLTPPLAPRFTSILTGVAGAGAADLITYEIATGGGVIAVASFRIAHRLGTSGSWTEGLIPAANGGGTIDAYASGNTVQLRGRSVSAAGIEGPWSDPVTITVGADDAPIPAALNEETIDVVALLGGALIQLATGSDVNTTGIQIYHSTSGTLDRDTDAVGAPYAVSPMTSFSIALGDTTRTNLITGSTMDAPADWTLDANWDIAGGVATHTAGAEDSMTQALTTEAGRWYRLGFGVSGRTAGTVTPRLTGGTASPGAAISADGTYSDRIQAAASNDTFGFLGDTDFDGSVDDVVAYLETAACLASGTHYIWIEPQNDDGMAGPLAGPFTINII